MSNLIQAAKDQVAALTSAAYEKAAAAGKLPSGADIRGTVEIPKDARNGDFATSFAMAGAKALKSNPRTIARTILENLELGGTYFDRAEIAGPGFLNLFLSSRWYAAVVAEIESEGPDYGASDAGRGERVMVEFVSANPTGPMHMGNARGGVLGDSLANVLARAGYGSWKEFYVNDAGNQIHKFAVSIYVRYMQLLFRQENFNAPDADGKEDQIRRIAQTVYEACKRDHLDVSENTWCSVLSSSCLEQNISETEYQGLEMAVYRWYVELVREETNYPFPEEGYHGDDVKELAQAFYEAHGDVYRDRPEEEALKAMSAFGLERNIPKMKDDLRKYGVEYDQWFFESSLHDSGYVAETVALLAEKGWTYEKDGALWLNTTALLKEKYMREGKTREQADKLDLKDDVLRRANGFYTYFAADIAYHRNKFAVRGFDKVVNIWGADHHGHVARLQAALDGLGLDGSNRLVIVLMQLVNLLQDGKPVRMSKRSGKAIALHDLLDEISVDAARYFFNNRTPSSALDFDLDLAVREDSENPVYYVQYAHARICSLVSRLAGEGLTVPAAADAALALLTGEEERALIKSLALYPEEIRQAAQSYDPSRINRYVTGLAGDFHRFYNACRIKGEEAALASARLKLADTVRAVVANALTLLGVSAPEKM